MSAEYEYSVEFADTHVEVRVSGVPDRPSIERLWKDIVSLCREKNCFRILGLSSTERAIELEHAMDYSTIFEQAGLLPGFRVAWVQFNPAAAVMIELIIETTRKRFNGEGKVFFDEIEARRWLLEAD